MSIRAWRSTAALVAILVIVVGVGITAGRAAACPAHAHHATKALGHHRHHAHRHHRRRHHKPRLDQLVVSCTLVGRIGLWAPPCTVDEPWHLVLVVK